MSQPLLSRSFKHAVDTFNDEPGILSAASRATSTTCRATPSCTTHRHVPIDDGCTLMLGNTVGNTEHEPNFSEYVLGRGTGRLLLFDVDYGFQKSSDAEEIRRKDPAFHHPMPEAHRRWLSGPYHSVLPGEFRTLNSPTAGLQSPLAGSYGIQCWARARFIGNQTRDFHMFNFRRYDAQGPDPLPPRLRLGERRRLPVHWL